MSGPRASNQITGMVMRFNDQLSSFLSIPSVTLENCNDYFDFESKTGIAPIELNRHIKNLENLLTQINSRIYKTIYRRLTNPADRKIIDEQLTPNVNSATRILANLKKMEPMFKEYSWCENATEVRGEGGASEWRRDEDMDGAVQGDVGGEGGVFNFEDEERVEGDELGTGSWFRDEDGAMTEYETGGRTMEEVNIEREVPAMIERIANSNFYAGSRDEVFGTEAYFQRSDAKTGITDNDPRSYNNACFNTDGEEMEEAGSSLFPCEGAGLSGDYQKKIVGPIPFGAKVLKENSSEAGLEVDPELTVRDVYDAHTELEQLMNRVPFLEVWNNYENKWFGEEGWWRRPSWRSDASGNWAWRESTDSEFVEETGKTPAEWTDIINIANRYFRVNYYDSTTNTASTIDMKFSTPQKTYEEVTHNLTACMARGGGWRECAGEERASSPDVSWNYLLDNDKITMIANPNLPLSATAQCDGYSYEGESVDGYHVERRLNPFTYEPTPLWARVLDFRRNEQNAGRFPTLRQEAEALEIPMDEYREEQRINHARQRAFGAGGYERMAMTPRKSDLYETCNNKLGTPDGFFTRTAPEPYNGIGGSAPAYLDGTPLEKQREMYCPGGDGSKLKPCILPPGKQPFREFISYGDYPFAHGEESIQFPPSGSEYNEEDGSAHRYKVWYIEPDGSNHRAVNYRWSTEGGICPGPGPVFGPPTMGRKGPCITGKFIAEEGEDIRRGHEAAVRDASPESPASSP